MTHPLIVDAHQDIAYNILSFGRDYTLSAADTRRLEIGTQTPQRNGDTLLGWPDYQRGNVAVVFSTLFAAPGHRREGDWETLVYTDYAEAHSLYRAQVDAYHRLADDHPEYFSLVQTQVDLKSILDEWKNNPIQEEVHPEEGYPVRQGNPVGLVLLMEGAEGIRHPDELEEWWEMGVRMVGPAWAGTRFCGGTHEPGPLTKDGLALLEGMADLGFGLDISHMDETAVLQALDMYPGTIFASHSNAASLLRTDSNRHLSNRVIHGVIERNGMIGTVFYNSFLKGGWRRGDRRDEVTLGHVITQIDTICQVAGDARHVGLGTDFDGGFGVQSVPPEIDTIADLQKLTPLLSERGYSQEEIDGILGQNWLTMLQKILPPGS